MLICSIDLEISLVMLFLPGVFLLVLLNPSRGINIVEELPSTETLQAHAYAMPASGWSPLAVHFSGFGSLSATGSRLRFEWDLDGNGRYDTDGTDAGGYVSYVYKKPGDYTITLKVSDELGNSATDQISVRVRYPGSSSVDYWTVFDDSQVRRVELRIRQENWDLIWEDPYAKVPVETDVLIFGEELQTVGVSLKGNSSMGVPGEKKSWKIDTDYFIPDQEFHNLKSLLFNNNLKTPHWFVRKWHTT